MAITLCDATMSMLFTQPYCFLSDEKYQWKVVHSQWADVWCTLLWSRRSNGLADWNDSVRLAFFSVWNLRLDTIYWTKKKFTRSSKWLDTISNALQRFWFESLLLFSYPSPLVLANTKVSIYRDIRKKKMYDRVINEFIWLALFDMIASVCIRHSHW